jgi:NADH:ubiquinone oxidoreductase subunit F (NADH-binding)
VRFGGPAGPFFAGRGLETPLEPAELEKTGATMGAGALEVFAGGRCGVDMAIDAMAYLHEESCGKCVFCREGSRQLLDILTGISEGRAGEEQMRLLREIAEAMGAASICSIGQGAALPVLSALELFADDFEAHLAQKRCPGKTT